MPALLAQRLTAWARRHPLPVAVLFFLGLLYLQFPGVVLLRRVPYVNEMGAASDLLHFNYPMRYLLGEGLAHGRVPRWTDAVQCGFPVHAEAQGGFLYPPNLLLGLLPLVPSLCLSLVTILLGTGVMMFLYAREIGQSRTGALFAGMVLAFSGFFSGHLRHFNLIAAAQWTPLLLLLCERYARTRRAGWLLALAPVQALQHLAGHEQIAFYSALFAGGYLLWRLCAREACDAACGQPQPSAPEEGAPRAPVSRRWLRRTGLPLLAYAGVCALGVGLAGAQVVPSVELLQHSARTGRLSYENAMQFSLPPAHLGTLVAPFALGDPGRNTYPFGMYGGPAAFWEHTAYVGLVPLALALFAAVRLRRRNPWAAFFRVVVVLSLYLALGKWTPLYPLLWRVIPGLGAFRVPSRFLLFTDLGFAVLAGFGIDLLRAVLARQVSRGWRPWILGLHFLLAAVDLLRFNARQYALVDPARWLSPPPAARVVNSRPARVFRYYYLTPWRKVIAWNGGSQQNPDTLLPLLNFLLPNQNVLSEVSHFGVYAQLSLANHSMVENAVEELLSAGTRQTTLSALRLLGLFHVGYLACGRPLTGVALPEAAAYPLPGTAPVRLYRNPWVLPRAYPVRGAEVVRGRAAALQRLVDPDFDPLAAVVLEDPRYQEKKESKQNRPLLRVPEDQPRAGEQARRAAAAAKSIRWLRDDAEEVLLEVDFPHNAWLVLADSDYPGWRATVDGHAVPVFRANVMARAVSVPRGRHQIRFVYQPASWDLGWAVAGGSLALLLLAVLACWRAPRP
ncbi:MAG: YfhO family protein [Armatimonadota bacterium]|nr:YfhO family protein [Armatimonadota bacterium]